MLKGSYTRSCMDITGPRKGGFRGAVRIRNTSRDSVACILHVKHPVAADQLAYDCGFCIIAQHHRSGMPVWDVASIAFFRLNPVLSHVRCERTRSSALAAAA
jgi:hypothetical protein